MTTATARSTPGVCRFIFSTDLTVLVRCRIDKLLPLEKAEELIGDEPLDVEVDLVLDGQIFRTARSSQAVFDPSPEGGSFRPQHFVFAAKVRDLPLQCSFIFWLRAQGASSHVYRGVLPLFNKRSVLRQGYQFLALSRCDDMDGRRASFGTERTGYAAEDWAQHSNELIESADIQEALRLAEAADYFQRGCLPPGFQESEEFFAHKARDGLENSGIPWLGIHLPDFQHPVLFAEPRYNGKIPVPEGVLAPSLRDEASTSMNSLQDATWLLQPLRDPANVAPNAPLRGFKCFIDYDAENEHPAVLKSMKLAKSSVSREEEKKAIPNKDQLDKLNELIKRPGRNFNAEEKHMLQRFRWSLKHRPEALTTFLHAVDWNDAEDKQDAIELLNIWSPADIDDALELLSKDFRDIRELRKYAVMRLENASDAVLELYLLQLVQALRYEPQHELIDDTSISVEPPSPSRRASLTTSVEPSAPSTLAGFLISRAVKCCTLATRFYWYLVAEAADHERGAIFERVKIDLMNVLGDDKDGKVVKQMLERQIALRMKLFECLQYAKEPKRNNFDKKVERFREAMNSIERMDLARELQEAIPFPVDPTIMLHRVVANECNLMKSAMLPGVIKCEVSRAGSNGSNRFLKKVMVKKGDDLRQDQLILQLIILMDSILKKYNLDLQLTPYQVVALSLDEGIVEFVDGAQNISAILKDYNNDIQQYLRAVQPLQPREDGGEMSGGYGPHNSYGIKPDVLENFIRSSAGYCVITYILGIGDRHLDNLMVTRDGRLFHIDFGFILGKDPKPFPPPMRLCKEMVEGMGGNDSPDYQSFKNKCCQAYKLLRRHAKLIINLLYLMTDSGIKDLSGDPQFAILKVEQKFQLKMNDEEAERYFLNLIEESVSALFPVLMETLHKISVAIK